MTTGAALQGWIVFKKEKVTMHVVQSWHILPRVTVESAWNLSTLGYVEQ